MSDEERKMPVWVQTLLLPVLAGGAVGGGTGFLGGNAEFTTLEHRVDDMQVQQMADTTNIGHMKEDLDDMEQDIDEAADRQRRMEQILEGLARERGVDTPPPVPERRPRTRSADPDPVEDEEWQD